MAQDIWSEWLLTRRFGGDATEVQRVLDYLGPIRDRVLRHAALSDGETLLDIGCGDGLIAFGALQSTETARIIFSDISRPLLDHARELATQMNALTRCEFVRAGAEDLSPFADRSVDAVTTRSVLIYVNDKRGAFREFYRVLRPHGRLSIFEPINRFRYPQPSHMFWGFDVTPVAEVAAKVKCVFEAIQPPGVDPMLDFDERDLLEWAESAGFRDVHLTLEAEVVPLDRVSPEPPGWDAMLRIAGNPRIPSLGEAMERALTPDEREVFVSHLCPLVEAKQGVHASAMAYLWATKH